MTQGTLELVEPIDLTDVVGLARAGRDVPVGLRLLPLVDHDANWLELQNGEKIDLRPVEELWAIQPKYMPNPLDHQEIQQGISTMLRRVEKVIEKMRWDALAGSVWFDMERDNGYVIDFGFHYGARPTTTIPWTDHENATWHADMDAWVTHMRTKQLGTPDDPYQGELFVWMNSLTYRQLLFNDRRRDLLSAHYGVKAAPYVPSKSDVVLSVGANKLELNDAGWIWYGRTFESDPPDKRNLVHYLPEGRVVITTNPAERAFGRIVNGWVKRDKNLGPHEEIKMWGSRVRGPWAGIYWDSETKQNFIKVAYNTLPMIDNPECIMCCTAY